MAVRNLAISKAVGTDAITVQKSTKVWIDHNTLSSDRDHGKDYAPVRSRAHSPRSDCLLSWS